MQKAQQSLGAVQKKTNFHINERNKDHLFEKEKTDKIQNTNTLYTNNKSWNIYLNNLIRNLSNLNLFPKP